MFGVEFWRLLVLAELQRGIFVGFVDFYDSQVSISTRAEYVSTIFNSAVDDSPQLLHKLHPRIQRS